MSAEIKLIAISILKIFNVVGLIFLIALTFLVLNRIAKQAVINHNDTQSATNRIEGDLGCLGRFFSQTNRTDLKIQDLSSCTIVNTVSGQTTVLPKGNTLNTNGSNQPNAPSTPAKTQSSQTVVPQSTTAPPVKTTTTSAPPNPNSNPGVVQQIINNVTQPVKDLIN